MGDNSKRDDQMAFSLLPTNDGKPPVLSIGIPWAAWEKIKNGDVTHSIDLTKIGIGFRVVLWGTPTHDEAVAKMFEAAKAAGVPILDERRRDFSIDLPGRAEHGGEKDKR